MSCLELREGFRKVMISCNFIKSLDDRLGDNYMMKREKSCRRFFFCSACDENPKIHKFSILKIPYKRIFYNSPPVNFFILSQIMSIPQYTTHVSRPN